MSRVGDDPPRDRDPDREPKPVRLFVAVDAPEAVAAELLDRVRPMRDAVRGARWTRPDGWHVTLKFLGWTHPEVLGGLEAALGSVAPAIEPFVTRLTRLGAFPAPSRARVLWAGLDDPGGRFARTVGRLDEALAGWVERERRAFEPHLTLARIDPPGALGRDVLGLDVASEPFAVDRLVLYRSHLSPKGATYEAVSVMPLGRDPGAPDA